MPRPIPSGLNFHIQYNKYTHPVDMDAMKSASDHYNIGYMISGDRKSITTSNISEHHAGQVGMMSPGILHRTISMSDVTYERILIKYTPQMAESFIELVGKATFDKLYEEHIHSFTPSIQKKICTMMMDMKEEYDNYNMFSEVILQGMLTRLLLTIMNERIPSEYETIYFPYENESIMKATYYIEQNYNQHISIKNAADYVNLSPSYFSALFKKILGTTFSQHLTNTRLQRAILLMNEQKFSISEIAEKCGFSNGNYLCDCFKKRYGLSPTAYRNLNTTNKNRGQYDSK